MKWEFFAWGGGGSPVPTSTNHNTTQKVYIFVKTKNVPYVLKCKINHNFFSLKNMVFPNRGKGGRGPRHLEFWCPWNLEWLCWWRRCSWEDFDEEWAQKEPQLTLVTGQRPPLSPLHQCTTTITLAKNCNIGHTIFFGMGGANVTF